MSGRHGYGFFGVTDIGSVWIQLQPENTVAK